MPGEFEPVEELLVAWSSDLERFFVDLIASAAGRVAVTVAVGPDESVDDVAAVLADFGMTSAEVRVVPLPVDTVWVRDFGPLVVSDGQGGRRAIDLQYLGSERDEAFSSVAAAELWGLPSRTDRLVMDGGNLLSDGTGRCVTTGFVIEQSLRPDDAADLPDRVRELFGCRELVVVPRLFGEQTGHVDMFVAIPGPGRALVGTYAPAQDEENALLLDEAADQLAAAGFDVTRVPMGDNGDGAYRTYTNLVPLNDAVLVPVYPDRPLGEREALRVIAAAYPGRQIIPVDASAPIALGGALHCATMALPAL